MLREEGIPERFVTIGGQTREGVTYRETNGRVSAVFEPPPQVTRTEARELRARCRSLLARSSWLVCSGSSPCRQTDDLYRLLLRDARARQVPTALDSYGPALALGVASRPTLLKANREEYESTFRLRLRSTREIRALLAARTGGGSEICVITDGPRPVHAAGGGRFYRIWPPATRCVNPTGSGDSMLAGILVGLEKGWDLGRSLVYGVAAGVANASVWTVAAGRAATIAHIVRAVQLEEF
jgi:tagatose 6-phosphate kinase